MPLLPNVVDKLLDDSNAALLDEKEITKLAFEVQMPA